MVKNMFSRPDPPKNQRVHTDKVCFWAGDVPEQGVEQASCHAFGASPNGLECRCKSNTLQGQTKGLMRIIFTLAAAISLQASAQDTLFTEDFQAAPVQFSLNTADVGSSTSGYNHWVVNADYTGGAGSGSVCGIPVTFNIPVTAAQPGGVTGGPNSMYMHTVSDLAIASGIMNCNFLAADGFCNFSENYFSAMSTDVSTLGYDTVHFSFWWLCAGSTNSFGELYWSNNSGLSWNVFPGPGKYNNASGWVFESVMDPVFANQPQLRFGFRFVNNTTLTASDPGFGIDEVMITGIQGTSTAPVAAFSASAVTFCQESCIDFTDSTTNNPTAWQWFFPGALPDTSTMQHPMQICYSDTGIFDVTLIVTNGQGMDTLVKTGYIHSLANPQQPVIMAVGGDTLCTTFVPGYTYQWYFNLSTVIPGATDWCYEAMFPGTYTVEVTDINGCKSLSDPFLVTGVEESAWTAFRPEVMLAEGNLVVKFPFTMRESYMLYLYNAAGRLVHDGAYPNGNAVIDVTTLSAGIYILRMVTPQGPFMRKVPVYR